MKKTTGTISFIGGVISFILLVVYIFLTDDDLVDSIGLLVCIGLFILCISVIHYTLSTKFWASKISVIESLDRENQIIKKQIEKRELLVKLEHLEGK